MKKRKTTKQQPNRGQGNKVPMSSPRSMDKVMSDRSNLLAQHEFSSFDEIKAFLKERIRLTKKALNITQDCANSYVLLAEEAARST